LIVWLDLGGWRVLRDDLRWLRRSAATVRDIDVVLQRFAGRPWAPELAAQRSLGASDLRAAFANPRVQGLVQAMAVMPSVSEEAVLDHLAAVRHRTLRAGKRLGRTEKDLAQVHRLRRAVRRLRYVLEWIGDAPEELAELQSELGLLNDLVIMERLLSDRPGEDGIAADRAVVDKELAAHCGRIQDLWDDARKIVEGL
jgi:CHAD domain-containing protein